MDKPQDPSLSRFNQALYLLRKVEGVEGFVVASIEGLPLGVWAGNRFDTDALAAAAASLGQLARRALAGTGRSELDLGVIDTDTVRLLVRPLSLGFLLAVVSPEADTNIVLSAMTDSVAALENAAAEVIEQISG